MMERRLLHTCSLLLLWTSVITAQNSFIATFPKTISKDLTLPISVHVLKVPRPLTVTADLQDEANITITTVQETVTTPGQLSGSKFVTLQLPIPPSVFQKKDFETDEYTITITGNDGADVFSETAKVKLSAARPTLHVVTDKDKYHPGDKVNFLVYGRHPDGSVVRRPYNVIIKDSEGNRVEQYLNVMDQNAMVSGSFVIPKHRSLGRWTIIAKQDDKTQRTSLTVNNYELPQFDVQVDVPQTLKHDFKELQVDIVARHPDGRGVSGKVNLEVYRKNRGSIKKTASIQGGNVTLIITKAEIAKVFGNLNYLSLHVRAVVEEDVTGERVTESENTYIQGDYDQTRINFPRGGQVIFKPGIPFQTTVKVTDDGEPLVNPASRVNITATSSPSYAYSFSNPAFSTNLYDIPVDGQIDLAFDIPADAKRMKISANYEKRYGSLNAVKAQSPSNNYLKIRRNSQDPIDTLPSAFDVTATEPVNQLNFMISDKGEIAYVGSFDMNGATSGTVPLPTLPEVTSTLTLLAYYVRGDGEVVTDAIEIAKGKPNPKKTSLQLTSGLVDPGSNVRLLVNNAKGSFMLLRGTDKRLDQSEDGRRNPFNPTDDSTLNDMFPKDSDDAFRKVGLLVLSDANVYRYEPKSKCSAPVPFVEPVHILYANHGAESSKDTPLIPYSSPQDLVMESPYRTTDDDSWLWRKIAAQNGFGNETVVALRAPRSLGTWELTALSLEDDQNDKDSLPKAQLRVTLPFYIRVHLPYSVQAGEDFVLVATVYNYLNYDAEVLVTLGKNDGWFNVVPLLLPNGKSTLSRTSSKVGRLLQIKRGSLGYAVFPIIPKEAGDLQVILTARTQSGGMDAVKATLRVHPAGIEVKRSWATLIDQNDRQGNAVIMDMNEPGVKDDDVTRVDVRVSGDVIGPSISVLDGKVQDISSARFGSVDTESLVKVLAPNIPLSRYYTDMGSNEKENPDFIQDYERLVSMQLPDGSFSSFGQSDVRGGTWMTAVALGIMNDLRNKVQIDQTVESQAAQWLMGQQNQDGSFQENGRLVEMSLQGGSAGGPIELTAFVLRALQGVSCQGCADTAIQKARDYLEKEVDTATSPHQLTMAAHALQLVGSTKVPTVLSKLDQKATMKGGKKYWKNGEPEKSTWFPKPKEGISPLDLETAAYYVATLLDRGNMKGSLPTLRWILSLQKDDKFDSIDQGVLTTEAVMQLLYVYAAIADKIKNSMTNLYIETTSQTPGETFRHTFQITPDNALLLQSVNVPKGVKLLQVSSTGPGVALVEVNRYHSQDLGLPLKDVTVSATIQDESPRGYTLNLCTRKLKPSTRRRGPMPMLGRGRSQEASAVMVVDIPEGTVPSLNKRDINVMSQINRHTIDNGKLILYLLEIGNTRGCIPAGMTYRAPSIQSQPSRVTLYELDKPDKKYTTFFEPASRRDPTECERRCGLNCIC